MIQRWIEDLNEICECSRSLRSGGPAPEDLQELSDSLELAVHIASRMLTEIEK